MSLYNKQHLTNIWGSVHEKFKPRWGCVEKKALLIKKTCSLSNKKSGYTIFGVVTEEVHWGAQMCPWDIHLKVKVQKQPLRGCSVKPLDSSLQPYQKWTRH